MPESIVDQGKKDLATSYQTMMGLAAWRHFTKNILDRIEELATKEEDELPLDDLTPARIAESRGKRAVIAKIYSDIDFIVNGGAK